MLRWVDGGLLIDVLSTVVFGRPGPDAANTEENPFCLRLTTSPICRVSPIHPQALARQLGTVIPPFTKDPPLCFVAAVVVTVHAI